MKPRGSASIRVEDHLGLVHMVARRYAGAVRGNGGLDYEDIVQAGSIGLLKAAERFDPARGSFATFAVWWVRQAIQREVADRAETVRVPTHEQATRRKAGRPARAVVCSLDVPTCEGGDSFLDMLAAPERDGDLPSLDDLIEATPTLTEREARVLRLKAQDIDCVEIGRELGFTRERARQVFLAAAAKVRDALGIEAGDDHTSQSLARFASSRERSRGGARARAALARRRAAERAERAA